MPYLVCEKCKGYYTLKHGESSKDFEKCNCGGKLKLVDSIEDPGRASDKKFNKQEKIKSGKDYSKQFLDLKEFIKVVNKRINPICIIIGLAVSVIGFILASFIFGTLMVITGISSIIFYGAITLVSTTLIGSFVTSFLGSQHIEDGAINGTILSLILLIAMGLITGFVLFIVLGVVASVMAALSPLASLGASAANSSGSTPNPVSSLTSLLNLFYGLIIIILMLIAGAGGGAFGVYIKKKLKIPL
jgi:MFS family permease